jgi:hypothetical protein
MRPRSPSVGDIRAAFDDLGQYWIHACVGSVVPFQHVCFGHVWDPITLVPPTYQDFCGRAARTRGCTASARTLAFGISNSSIGMSQPCFCYCIWPQCVFACSGRCPQRRRFLATPGSDSTDIDAVHGGSGAHTARQAASDDFFDVRHAFKSAVPPESVRVYVRIRPMTHIEAAKDRETMTFGADAKAVCLRLEDDVPHDFRFSHVFTPECSQMDVFHQAGRPVVDAVLSGFNAAILCYGQVLFSVMCCLILGLVNDLMAAVCTFPVCFSQTGSGKTHTMIGSNVLHHDARGLVPRIMEHIFHVQEASPPQFVYEVRCSFIEIYLDKLADLLAPVKDRALKLREREDGSFFTTAAQVQLCRCFNGVG